MKNFRLRESKDKTGDCSKDQYFHEKFVLVIVAPMIIEITGFTADYSQTSSEK